MKNILISLAILSVFACKKKEEPTPDYSESLVGTYIGMETYATPGSASVTYSNSSKTMTVTRLDKNRIQVSTFNNSSKPIFTLSDGGSTVNLTPEAPLEAQGSSVNNSYTTSTKVLRIDVKIPSVSGYMFFQGDKQ